jgi:hypothetical protein
MILCTRGSTGENVGFAARFDEDPLARVTQLDHERDRPRLKQGLAPPELDEGRAETEGAGEHFVPAHARAPVEGLSRVAPDAAQIATGQPHEGAGQAGEGRFSLDARVDLVNDQCIFLHGAALSRADSDASRDMDQGGPDFRD